MENLQQTTQNVTTSSDGSGAKLCYVDTHAHIFDADFDDDRSEMIARAVAAGITKIILPAIDSHSHEALIRTIKEYPDVCHAAIGMHPTSVNGNTRWREELQMVRGMLRDRPVEWCAIGEVGLDLHWSTTSLTEQSQALVIQMQLAIDYDLPLILHVRDAWNEIFPLLEPVAGQIRGVFHSFQGRIQDYENIQKIGNFAIGIGGFVTYKNAPVAKVLEHIPLDNIVLETDSPYLTPVPFRGHRNESVHITVIAAKIAEIKGVSIEEVMEVTTRRAKSLFF